MVDSNVSLSTGQLATLACILEVTAPKPGNVHRGADFDDATYLDFVASAVAIGPAMEAAAGGERLGQTVLSAVRATCELVGTNTNLGTVLLLTPLAMVDRAQRCAEGIGQVLDTLNADDARLVYEAIRLARPAGLGNSPEADVHGDPPAELIEAMRSAAERDLVARQYATGFDDVLRSVVPALVQAIANGWPLADCIVHVHLLTMRQYPDSLIARKRGLAVAEESAQRAARALESGQPGEERYHRAVADLDFWLRADGRGRNPGTTADLIAAGLFVALRDGIIERPRRFYAEQAVPCDRP